MLRHITFRNLFVTLLLTTTACTQPAAKIDLRGQNNYSHDAVGNLATNNVSTYSSYQPSAGTPVSYGRTDSTASIESIGVSDLSPPSNGTPATNKVAPPPAPKPLASNDVNPWTSKQRGSAASAALDSSFHSSPQAAAPAPVKTASLSNIVSNDNSSLAQKDTGPVRKVKKTEMAASSGFMWPVGSKKILSEFGPKGKGKVNEGINIASAAGEPVWAAADGEVVYVGNELQGYGNIVIIKHSGDKTTTYAHLNRYTVDKYDRIKQGDIIGYVGSTGNVKDPQLHFAIRDGKDAVDPMKYLGQSVASLR